MKYFFYWGIFFLGVSSFLNAASYTEKTFLMPQSLRIPTESMLFDYSNDLMLSGKHKLFGGCMQVTPFYRVSTNGTEIGKYFGWSNNNTISIDPALTGKHFSSFELIHNPNDLSSLYLRGTIELSPKQKIYGIHINYLQEIFKNFYFNAIIPVVHVSNSMKPKVNDILKATIDGNRKGILHYFSGEISQEDNPSKQEALHYAKISGYRSKTGIADLELLLSYKFTRDENYYLRPMVSVVLPTGNRTNGEYLFEPVLGNGKQWGVGCGIDAMFTLYDKNYTKIDLTCAYNIKHFVSNTQKRTIGFRSDGLNKVYAWSQYRMLGEDGIAGVFPAANVLTRDVKVRQGILFDCDINFNVYHNNWLFNLGYNYFSRSDESVSVKSWDDDKYARAAWDYKTTSPFLISNCQEGAIQKSMLNVAAAATPASITHKIYGILSYTFASARTPFFIGIGASGEFAQENSALQGYELYARLGFSF